MIGFIGLLILFVMDFHHLVIEALTASYDFMPVGSKALTHNEPLSH